MEPDLIACYAVIWLTRSSNTIPLPLETKLKFNKVVRSYMLPLTEQLRQLRAWLDATQTATRTRTLMIMSLMNEKQQLAASNSFLCLGWGGRTVCELNCRDRRF